MSAAGREHFSFDPASSLPYPRGDIPFPDESAMRYHLTVLGLFAVLLLLTSCAKKPAEGDGGPASTAPARMQNLDPGKPEKPDPAQTGWTASIVFDGKDWWLVTRHDGEVVEKHIVQPPPAVVNKKVRRGPKRTLRDAY
jgi:hypothetical protein